MRLKDISVCAQSNTPGKWQIWNWVQIPCLQDSKVHPLSTRLHCLNHYTTLWNSLQRLLKYRKLFFPNLNEILLVLFTLDFHAFNLVIYQFLLLSVSCDHFEQRKQVHCRQVTPEIIHLKTHFIRLLFLLFYLKPEFRDLNLKPYFSIWVLVSSFIHLRYHLLTELYWCLNDIEYIKLFSKV